MYLSQLRTYSPQDNAYFVNSEHTLAEMHQSTDYLAFTTRSNELILKNMKTGRASILHRSDHGIVQIKFTHQYLLVVEQSVHQILVFSLTNEKLKKKLTGHRSQIIKLAYCRQRMLFASISHDQCIIHNQGNLSREKLLKCSTSSFTDCIFSLSGSVFITSFKDSSIFFWNLQDYSHCDIAIAPKNLKLAINHNSILAVYNSKTILLLDINKQVLKFQQLHQFWQGHIRQVNFVQNLLIINTDLCFYMVQIIFESQFIVKTVKQTKNSVNFFTTSEYQSLLLLLTGKYRNFSLMKIQKQKKILQKTEKSPLTNEGLVCAGGYSNSQGCFLVNNINTNVNYGEVNYQVEKISAGTYSNMNTSFSIQKLRQFVRKHHSLPQKHRLLAYRFLLKLPTNSSNFRILQNKGRHECIDLLDAKYPLQNLKLSETMKNILSLLAHYHPIFAQYDNIPAIIFPFICLFGNDSFFCFQFLYRLFTRNLAFLFDQFPVANSKYLQNMYEMLSKQDPELVNYLTNNNISFTKIVWGLLSNLFTLNLNRDNFLSVIDTLLVHPNEPEYIMFVCLGYLIYNRARIFTVHNQAEMTAYFQQEHTVHIGKFLKVVDQVYEHQRQNVFYEFKLIDLDSKNYLPLTNVPKDTLKMYENKRKVLTEQLHKKQEEEVYKDKMLKQMQKMMIKAKRDSERQMIQRQSYALHCQNESQNKLHLQTRDHSERVHKIQSLMEELTKALENEQNKKELIKNYLPAYTNLNIQSNEQLDSLQAKLMNLLTQINPNSFNHPLKNQPFSILKPTVNDQKAFKSSLNSQLANKLWELDDLSHANQAIKWENNLISSMKV